MSPSTGSTSSPGFQWRSTSPRSSATATLPDRPRISLLEKRYFDMVELKRLFQVNLYHMQNKFPGDTKRKAREAAARR